MDNGYPEREVALIDRGGRALSLEVQLNIAIFPGCDGSLEGKRYFGVYIGRWGRCEVSRGRGVHVGCIEFCNHYGVGPGRVSDTQTKNAVLETCSSVYGCEPVKALVPLLVGVAITPVNYLLGRDGLFPYEGEVTASGSCLYELFPIVSYRPGLYLHPSCDTN